MANQAKPEVWLRGPVEGIIPLLQPIAHALLQAQEEVETMLQSFREDQLWLKPMDLASVGFHLQHLSGVLDRLFTYARGEALSQSQLDALRSEGVNNSLVTSKDLVTAFGQQVAVSIIQLKQVREQELTSTKLVGRSKIPSTTIGLYVHAAEHTMRHVGQLLVTVRCIKNTSST